MSYMIFDFLGFLVQLFEVAFYLPKTYSVACSTAVFFGGRLMVYLIRVRVFQEHSYRNFRYQFSGVALAPWRLEKSGFNCI